MPTITSHDDGMPIWVDIMVATPEQIHELRVFLSALFDWTWQVGAPEMGYYSQALHDGAPVLGVGSHESSSGQATVYFATSDIDQSTTMALDLGASMVTPAMAVMDLGSLAVLRDPTGATYGLWQPQTFQGFGALYEANAPGWFDHTSTDPGAAAAFYGAITGHQITEPSPDMKILHNKEQWFASISHSQTGAPPQWMPIYVVDSLTKIHEVVPRHGGSIVIKEMPVPGSTISVFSEPVNGTLWTVMAAGEHAT